MELKIKLDQCGVQSPARVIW